MAAVRRGQGQMKVELPKNAPISLDRPPISALFFIYFDIKAGYTIGWKRSLPGVELEGVVEYKSLPSGLHTVKEDLIYFVHDRYAGLSAFANAPAAEESRNARMIAVGILVPLSYGRLGKSWIHADKLKEIAQQLVSDPKDTEVLEDYWNSHKADDDRKSNYTDISTESPSSIKFQPIRNQSGRPKGHFRKRSASDGTVLLPPEQRLSEYHPAWSLSALLDKFGPLIFPIHRAALLRRRILIVGHAPVQEACNFVYDISVLSNIPLAVTGLLSPSAPPQRLRPLFSIGVHDIPFLEDDLKAVKAAVLTPREGEDETEESGYGWIACTTDDILTVKNTLYDVLVTLPPAHSADAKDKVWPKVESPRGTEIKATQRDLRRYRTLKWALSRSTTEPESPALSRTTSAESRHMNTFADSPRVPTLTTDSALLDTSDTDSIIEPLSWSALAYSGFMWWASAGERRLATEDESENDSVLLDGFGSDPQTPRSARSRSEASLPQMLQGPDVSAKKEMAIIAYFHRLTTQILTTLSDIIDATMSDDEGEEATPLRQDSAEEADDEGPPIFVTSADLAKMGLDEWSSNDHAFIVELAKAYFGHTASVEGMSIDICGIRIC